MIQAMLVAIFLIIFWAHMNIFYIVKVKILVLIKWYIGPPQSCWLLNLEWWTNFEHIIHFF